MVRRGNDDGSDKGPATGSANDCQSRERDARDGEIDWKHQPADPNPFDDLNYELIDWMAVSATQNGTDYLMFIPEEEEMLAEDEFLVVHEGIVCDLVDCI